MALWVFVLLAIGCASADHDGLHISNGLTFQNDAQHTIAYAIPVQVYSHAGAAPAAEVYSAPAVYSAPSPQVYSAPAVYSAPSPQVYTATVAPAPQVYAAVTPAPQYAAHVQSYSAPSYSAHSYSAPSHSSHSYSASRYPAGTGPIQSTQSYSAPIHSSHSYSSSRYSPAYSVSSQYTSPVQTYSKTTYSAPSTVKSYSAVSKSSYSSPVKAITPQYSAVNFHAPAPQYQAPTVRYQSSAVNQYSSGAYVHPVAILRQSQDDGFDGSFNYDFQAENGIASTASGYVKQLSPKEQAQVIQGQYSYTAPDGTPVITRWYADETGFHAEGSHLPVAPPVPEAIAKSLAYQGVAY